MFGQAWDFLMALEVQLLAIMETTFFEYHGTTFSLFDLLACTGIVPYILSRFIPIYGDDDFVDDGIRSRQLWVRTKYKKSKKEGD